MRDIRVRKAALIDVLEKNRDNHRTEFLKAQENFRARAIEVMDEMLKDAREGRTIRRSIGLTAPEDHTSDYDHVIEMLKMSVESEIQLDEVSFRQYVRNEWAWFQRADMLNKTYASGMFVAENGQIGR